MPSNQMQSTSRIPVVVSLIVKFHVIYKYTEK